MDQIEKIIQYEEQVDTFWNTQIDKERCDKVILDLNEFFIPELADLIEQYTKSLPVQRRDGDIIRHGYLNSNGMRDGLWISYYNPPGFICKYSEGHYHDGIKTGLWTRYHFVVSVNQIAASQGFYLEGNKQGKWTYYRKNGSRRYEGEYCDDKRHGIWIHFDPTGLNIISTKMFNR